MVTARERVARDWHAGSDHADHAPFGGPLCNCDQVAERIMPMLAEAWDAGAQAQAATYGMDKDTGPNPYEEDRHADQ